MSRYTETKMDICQQCALQVLGLDDDGDRRRGMDWFDGKSGALDFAGMEDQDAGTFDWCDICGEKALVFPSTYTEFHRPEVIELKITAENPYSGARRVRVPASAVPMIDDWYRQQGKRMENEVRGFRRSKYGWISFQCGGGYAIVDCDLLGGSGTGRAEDVFRETRNVSFRMTRAGK